MRIILIFSILFYSAFIKAETAENNWKFESHEGLCGLEFYSRPIDGGRAPINVMFIYSYDITDIKIKSQNNLQDKIESVFISSATEKLDTDHRITLQGGSTGIITVSPSKAIIGKGMAYLLTAKQVYDFVSGLHDQQSFTVSFQLKSGEGISIIAPYGFERAYSRYSECKQTPKKRSPDRRVC